VGAEYCVTSCDLAVSDQAAEPVSPQNLNAGSRADWIHAPGGRILVQGPMRPMDEVIIDVLTQDVPQVPSTSPPAPT
jgi:hypothetical protein